MTRHRWRVEGPAILRTFLAEQLSLSVRQAKNLLDASRCQVNGVFERFGARCLAPGELVEVEVGDLPRGDPTVLYEDNDIRVLDKPAGCVSDSPEAVHRLDRDTSGVWLLAKNRKAAENLKQQFRERLVEKVYVAVVVGMPEKEGGVIQSCLGIKRRFSGQTIWGSVPKGKWAKTVWEKVEAGNGEALVRCYPVTGRTHQIRVHLAEMGYPVVGDGQYGRRGRMPGRHLLHAEKLTVRHPVTGESITFTSPAPFACKS